MMALDNEESRSCALCGELFTLDSSATIHASAQRAVCSHAVCISCVKQITSNIDGADEDVENQLQDIKCPLCSNHIDFNAETPTISTARTMELSTKKMEEVTRETGLQTTAAILVGERNAVHHEDKNDLNLASIKYEPEIFDFRREPLLLPRQHLDSMIKNATDVPPSVGPEPNDGNPSNESQMLERTSVRPQSNPGAVWVDGPHLNSTADINSDQGSTDGYADPYVVVEAQLVEEPIHVIATPFKQPTIVVATPLKEPKVVVIYRAVLLFIRAKKRILLLCIFLVSVSIAVILAVEIPKKKQNSQISQLLLRVSNKKNVSAFSESQMNALDWILGANNTDWILASDSIKLNEGQLIQRYVLALLYFSASGENWLKNPHFLSSRDECSWFQEAVSCSNDGKVETIQLAKNNLVGTLPSEIARLNQLKKLDLSQNLLSGTIPSLLGTLNKLTVLKLRQNKLSGSIPSELGNLERLTDLELSQNQLRGSVPAEVSQLPNLSTFFVFGNPALTCTNTSCVIPNWGTCTKGVDTCVTSDWKCCVGPDDISVNKTTCRPSENCGLCSSKNNTCFVAIWSTCNKDVDICARDYVCCVAPADIFTNKTTCRPEGDCV